MGEALHSITFLCCKHHYQNDSVQYNVLQKKNEYNNTDFSYVKSFECYFPF